MSTPTEIRVGDQYFINGKIHEVKTLTHRLISILNINEKREHITSSNSIPLKKPNEKFIYSSVHDVIEVYRKYYYVTRLKSILGGSLPIKSTMQEIWNLSRQYGDPSPPCYTSIWRWTRLCKNNGWSPYALFRKNSMSQIGKLTSETDDSLRMKNNALLIKPPSINTVHHRMKNIAASQPTPCAPGFAWHKNTNEINSDFDQSERFLENFKMNYDHIDQQAADVANQHQGRMAYLQVIIANNSNKIITYKLYYGPPSTEQTLRLLKRALTVVSGEELQLGKAKELIVDNGIEVTNTAFKLATQAMGIEIRHAPTRSPQSKSHIESTLRTMNFQSVHTLPVTIPPPHPIEMMTAWKINRHIHSRHFTPYEQLGGGIIHCNY